jgi:biotin-(acetyl-CoA carboxylase) ligase
MWTSTRRGSRASCGIRRRRWPERWIDAVAGELELALAAFETAGIDESLHMELQAHLAYLGGVRTWNGPATSVTGRVVGIDKTGRLVLDAGGRRITCETGELDPP